MDDDNKPFVVFKFLTHESHELTQKDDEFYDVGLANWITHMDENMEAKIKWPPNDAGNFVRKERSACPHWTEERIIVKRFYDTYINAITSCKGVLDDSNYETDKEFGRGKRKKKKNYFDLSESEKESDNEKRSVKSKPTKKYTISKNTKEIPSPPPVPVSSLKNMLSPERIIRQYVERPVLNIKVSESSKQSHINVLKTIRGKKKETDKTTQILERLNKSRHEKLHKHEQIAASCSIQKTVRDQNMYETQEIIQSPLKSVSKETSVKDGRSSHSPLQRFNSNTSNINSSRRHLFKTPEKDNYSSPLKSSSRESYGHHLISPSEIG